MNTNTMPIEPAASSHWNGAALDALTAVSFTLYLYRINSYENGKHVASAVVVVPDKHDAIAQIYVNQELSEVRLGIEVKLLGVAVSGVGRHIVLNTAV